MIDADRLSPLWPDAGLHGDWPSAGFLFFAFAGYARVATLGEEVREPAVTIPRAIPIALAVTLAVYAAVGLAVLLVLGPDGVGHGDRPAGERRRRDAPRGLDAVVRIGAALATLGVLLSLLAGLSRTVFAMAADGHLPRRSQPFHRSYKVPHVAEVAVGAVGRGRRCVRGSSSAIGFSSVTVLAYYAIANASAFTLPLERRSWPRIVPVLGFAGRRSRWRCRVRPSPSASRCSRWGGACAPARPASVERPFGHARRRSEERSTSARRRSAL